MNILVLISLIACCNAANILYIIPFTSKSHYIMLRPIGLELAKRGHNVTVITAFREDDHAPSYHQVMSDDIKIWEAFGGSRPNVFTMVDASMEEFHEKILWSGGAATTEIALKSKKVQEFLRKDNSFDLVISEQFFQEAFFTLAYKYNAPLVLVTTYGNSMRTNMIGRNPVQLSTVLHEFAMNRNPKSFFGRMLNLYYSVYDIFFWRFWYLSKQEAMVEKYLKDILPSPMPSLVELQKNASLVLMNAYFSVDTPTAYLPNFIEVGGLHLKESDNKLPDDLKKILDESKHGVIYVNFGSNVQSSELPEEKRDAFLNVFRRLKETVIWKWEDSSLKNKPDNLIIRKWLPQKEIFAHPSIKVFISHGGLIGTQEAIFNGIPIIGMPIYCDQYNNLLKVQEDGNGKILEYHDLNERSLERILKEVLNDNKYKSKAKEIQARFKDRPIKPLESAMFWIEYVIRHKGADFIKNPALSMSWISSSMLDVYAFLLAILLTTAYVLKKLGLFIIKLLFKQKTVTKYSVSRHARKKNE